MVRRFRVLFFSFVCLLTLRVVAQEQSKRTLAPGYVLVSDPAELDAIDDPASVRILELIDVSDGPGNMDDQLLARVKRFPKIRTLVVGCPQMTNKGLKQIAQLKNLECLVVYGSKITDAGIQDLKVLAKLQIVGLHHTAVTDGGIAKLKAALPKTYYELGLFGKSGQIFDANGCVRPEFVERHLTVQQNLAR